MQKTILTDRALVSKFIANNIGLAFFEKFLLDLRKISMCRQS